MRPRTRLRTARTLLGVLLVLAMAAMIPAVALAGTANNGTVKVHEGISESGDSLANDPEVCTFHLHFFFGDAGQAGSWSIDQANPTGSATGVLTGTYSTNANGEYATVEYGLPIGHYSVTWQGADPQNLKHKTFWVTCDNPPGPIGGGIG